MGPIKTLHMINATLWCINSLTWGLYAHSLPMAFVSGLATACCLYAARKYDY